MQKLYTKEQDLSRKLTDHFKTVEEQIKAIDKFVDNYDENQLIYFIH